MGCGNIKWRPTPPWREKDGHSTQLISDGSNQSENLTWTLLTDAHYTTNHGQLDSTIISDRM